MKLNKPPYKKKCWAQRERLETYLKRKYIHHLHVQEIIHSVCNEYRCTTV